MIFFLDFDFTIADTTPLKKGANWREAEITLFPRALEFINEAIKEVKFCKPLIFY